MNLPSVNTAPAHSHSSTRAAVVDSSALNSLVKHLICVAAREEALLAELTEAVSADDSKAIIAVARILVACHSTAAKSENCVNLPA